MAIVQENNGIQTRFPDNGKMNGDDSDEDLEALRIAALQSRKSIKNDSSCAYVNNGRNDHQQLSKSQWNGAQNRNWSNRIYKYRSRLSNLIFINTVPSEDQKSDDSSSLPSLHQNQDNHITPDDEVSRIRNKESRGVISNGPKKFSRLESRSDDSDYDDSSSSESEKSTLNEDSSQKLIQNGCNSDNDNEEDDSCCFLLPEVAESENVSCQDRLSSTVNTNKETIKTVNSAVDKNSLKQDVSLSLPEKQSDAHKQSTHNHTKRSHSPVTAKISKCSNSRVVAINENSVSDTHRAGNSRHERMKDSDSTVASKGHTNHKSPQQRRIITISNDEERSTKNLAGDDPLTCDPKTDLRLILKNKRSLAPDENSNSKEVERKKRKRSPTPDSPTMAVRSVLSVVRVKNIQREDEASERHSRKRQEERRERKRESRSRDGSPKLKSSKKSDDDAVKRHTQESKPPVHMRLGITSKYNKRKSSSGKRRHNSPRSGKDQKDGHKSNRKGDRNSGVKRY